MVVTKEHAKFQQNLSSVNFVDISYHSFITTRQNGVSTMFPGTYVPRYRCSPNLCSPVPMFPGTDVPRFFTLIVD